MENTLVNSIDSPVGERDAVVPNEGSTQPYHDPECQEYGDDYVPILTLNSAHG